MCTDATAFPSHDEAVFTDDDARLSLMEGGLFSLMVGLGETYLAAYALAVGAGEVVAGLLMTVPMLAGAALQVMAPWGVQQLASNRRWVVVSAACQAASLVAVPLVGQLSTVPVPLLFLCASVYWGAGLATGPAWNSWMEHLVPRPVRARFFARRARLCHACTLAGFVTGGVLLQLGKSGGWTHAAFLQLFVAAAASRLASSWLLAHQREPHFEPTPQAIRALGQTLTRLRSQDSVWLLMYIFITQVAVHTAAPFFTPYLLSECAVSYMGFMLLMGAGFVGKMLAMPLWGHFAHTFGACTLLRLGGLLIVPSAALWAVSANWYYLFLLQLVSGVAWAAQELGILLMFFEAIPYRERTSVLTIYNVGNTISIVAGAALGGFLLTTWQLASLPAWLPAHGSPYLLLFLFSSAARVIAIPLLVRIPDLAAEIAVPAVRVVSVRPDASDPDPPVLPSLPNPSPEPPGET